MVNLVEPLGRETLVRGSLPESEIFLNLQVAANWRSSPGDRLNIHLELNKLFIFDHNTGETF